MFLFKIWESHTCMWCVLSDLPCLALPWAPLSLPSTKLPSQFHGLFLSPWRPLSPVSMCVGLGGSSGAWDNSREENWFSPTPSSHQWPTFPQEDVRLPELISCLCWKFLNIFFKLFLFYFVCMGVLPGWMKMHPGHMMLVEVGREHQMLQYWSQEWLLAPVWMLGTTPGSAARAASGLGHWAISPGPAGPKFWQAFLDFRWVSSNASKHHSDCSLTSSGP